MADIASGELPKKHPGLITTMFLAAQLAQMLITATEAGWTTDTYTISLTLQAIAWRVVEV